MMATPHYDQAGLITVHLMPAFLAEGSKNLQNNHCVQDLDRIPQSQSKDLPKMLFRL